MIWRAPWMTDLLDVEEIMDGDTSLISESTRQFWHAFAPSESSPDDHSATRAQSGA